MSRTANFTSSSISKLTKLARNGEDFGAPALTYIEEKIMEAKLGRELQAEVDAQPTKWGTIMEPFAFDHIGLEYRLISKKRYHHPKLPWSGMPDVITEELIGDIKCPWTLKAFCKLVDAMGDIEALKKASPEYYWQLVSNAILCRKKKALLIVFAPYKEQLNDVRKHAMAQLDVDGSFINYKEDNELPYLLKGKFYKNINEYEFTVPKDDIDFLTKKVTEASILLEGRKD
jgi:hypothetical protein